MFQALWRWAKRRHRNKSNRWIYAKYFRPHHKRSSGFYGELRDKAGLVRPQRLVKWVPPLYLWIIIWGGNDAAIAVGVIAGMVICMIGFIPYLNFVAKKMFYFAGEGEPVPREELRTMIKEINRFNVPVTVQERGNTLVVTWLIHVPLGRPSHHRATPGRPTD